MSVSKFVTTLDSPLGKMPDTPELSVEEPKSTKEVMTEVTKQITKTTSVKITFTTIDKAKVEPFVEPTDKAKIDEIIVDWGTANLFKIRSG
jgi:hypothetical protein